MDDIPAKPCGGLFLDPSPLPCGEREPSSPRSSSQTTGLSTAPCALFPLPEGEGQGEGKRREASASDILERPLNSSSEGWHYFDLFAWANDKVCAFGPDRIVQ